MYEAVPAKRILAGNTIFPNYINDCPKHNFAILHEDSKCHTNSSENFTKG